jgi:hypothetical protein
LGLVAIFLSAACASTPGPEEGTKLLVGRYSLVVGSGNETALSRSLKQETLVLEGSGLVSQDCTFADGRTFHRSGGTWRYSDGNVSFRIRDCAGFLSANGADTFASLVVEFADPPIILLHPDLSVFYKRDDIPK